MLGYHVTDTHRVEQILREGLKPRDTGEWNHPGWSSRQGGAFVWFFDSYDGADIWVYSESRYTDREVTILTFDAEGIESESDAPICGVRGARKTRQPIEPHRFRLTSAS